MVNQTTMLIKLMNLSFENKVALVTGAASGMGLATPKAFAEAGRSRCAGGTAPEHSNLAEPPSTSRALRFSVAG